MRISKRELIKSSYFVILYSVICVYYIVDVLLFKDSYIIDVLFFVLSTLVIVQIFVFFRKFLRRYYQYQDKKHILTSILILEILHTVIILFFNGNFINSWDLTFLYKFLFILTTALLIIFYFVLFLKVNDLSNKHFKLLKLFSYSLLLIPMVVFVTSLSARLQGYDIMSSIENEFPVIVLSTVKIIPFLILAKIYCQATYRHKE
ncbi:MAG: hypothetical protein U9R42_03895 [Bacteroidota bacterium]|nr:hypothetical protein [Bacteroidota bacterium]